MLVIKTKILDGSINKAPTIKACDAKTGDCLSTYVDYRSDTQSNFERACFVYMNQLHSDLMCWNVVENVKIGEWTLFVIVTNEDVLLFNRSN